MSLSDDYKKFMPVPYNVKAGFEYTWCGCGKSNTPPLCDIDYCRDSSRVIYHAKLNETVHFCGCKHTKNPPFCDGSHGKILMSIAKNIKNSD